MVHHGLVPFLWDNGYTGNHGMGIFDRHTGEQVYPELVEAIVTALPEKNLINPVSPYTQ
jgi:endoglucanase